MEHRGHVVTLGLVLLCGLSALLGASKRPGSDADRQAILQADIELNRAVQGHDVETFKALIDDDGTFYSRSGPTTGRDAVAESWKPLLERERTSTLTWEPKSAEVADSGDLGFTRGEYDLRGWAKDGKVTHGKGHYVTIWRKGQDGRWRVAVDIGTPAQPVEAE